MYAPRTLVVWDLRYWASVWAVFWTLGIYAIVSHQESVIMGQIYYGLKVAPIKGIGPNVANWAISGPLVGLGSLPNIGPWVSW